VDFIDDVDLELAARRSVRDGLSQSTDIFDGVVGSSVDLLHIDGTGIGDALALLADPARFRRGSFDTVEGLGEDSSGCGLADSPSSGEEEGVGNPVREDRVLERLRDVFLTYDLIEGLRAKTASEDQI